MRKTTRLILFFVSMLFVEYAYSTHIVGGSLTYVYINDSTYAVTLKLYRDCSGINLPGSVDITVLGYDGVPFSPSKDFTMPRRSVSNLPSNLDSCATPPNPMPCVQEGIYTFTVNNFSPNPGGYHMYTQIVARNGSLSNINAPGSAGESFYAYIPGPTVYWLEDFTLANGTTVDNGATAWSISSGTTSVNSAQVNGNLFEVTGANDGEVIWTSQVINISTFTNGVDAKVSLAETGALENTDSINVFYSINGGTLTAFPINGILANDFTSATAKATGLAGNTLQLFIQVHYDNASPNSEVYTFDDVIVYESDTLINSNPVFDLFPPLFLCAGTPFTFDHKATDADGDSLAYAFYTPYDGDAAVGGPKDPTFSNNVATFLPVVWLAGFSATAPLGAPPLSLSATTGLLSGTPGSIGQFVVGVKVKEYRNGVLLSETLRDFQFNIIVCPPLAQAGLSPFNGCNGNAVSFSPDDTLGSAFWWDLGNTLATDDTSLLKFPTYTYPTSGTYTVTLIANKGTYCSDTAYTTVTTSTVSAAFSHNAPVCLGSLITFTNSSTKSANATIASYLWAFGDGSTSTTTSTNPTHTYTTTGVFSVSLTATNNFGCDSMTVKSLTVNPIPTANAGSSSLVCATSPAVVLNGSVTNATTISWTSNGTGAFTPNNTTLNATYTPSAADITAGVVTLTLSTTSNAPCNASDTMKITINATPTASAAGGDQTLCGITTATLAANTPATGTGAWSFVSGSAVITNSTSATTTVTGLTPGSSYTLRWTVSNGVCPPSTDDAIITVSLLATANAGSSRVVCATSPAVVLSGNITNAPGSSWTSDGTGAFTPNNTTINATYTPSAADIIAGIVTLTLSTTGHAPCDVSDTMQITISGVPTAANAGPDQTVCGLTTATLAANAPATGTGKWTLVSGSGIITNSASPTSSITGLTTGTTNTFRWTISNGACTPSTDDVVIKVDSLPTTANAGPDQYICNISTMLAANNPTVGTGGWSIIYGTPVLSSTVSPTATVSGLAAGDSIILRWTITKGFCTSFDEVTIVVNTILTSVNPGNDQTVCSSSLVQLNGNVSGNTTTGAWSSSGSGIFAPNANILNATYAFSNADTAAGAVTLYLTSTNNGQCSISIDSIQITIEIPAKVNAGPDQQMCENNPVVNLVGSVSGLSTTGQWSSPGDGNFALATNLSTSYTAGPNDISSGSFLVILSSTNNSTCPATDDSLTVTVTPAPIVTAGVNQVVCSNSAIQLSATVSGSSTTGVWSGNGTGTFSPNNTTLNGTYTPSIADITAGQVKLVLTSTNNGNCLPVTDTVQIDFFDLPIPNAGPDQITCSTFPSVTLSGSVAGGTSTGVWSTTGTGNFTPNVNTLSASYNISAADIISGSVYVILTSSNNGPCPSVPDTMKIDIIEQPSTSLADTFFCTKNLNSIELIGGIIGDTGTFIWRTSGTGTFKPNNTSNPIQYKPSAADIANGFVTIKFISAGNSPCANDTSIITLTLYPSPVSAFSPSKIVCFVPNDKVVYTNQSVNAISYIWSFGDGTPNTTLTNPSHNYTKVGKYITQLIAENNFGCTDTSEIEITVSGQIITPTGFTPDPNGPNDGKYIPGDLSNNIFLPYADGVTDYHLMIFNRWGELIFESVDITIGWNGYYRGKLCQQDTYVWKIEAKFNDGRDYIDKGSVTLLR